MKNIIRISKIELANLLANWKLGATKVSLQYETQPKLTKFGKEKFGIITKKTYAAGMIGAIYENSVNNAREKEEMERNFLSGLLWKGSGKRISLALAQRTEKIVVTPKTAENEAIMGENIISYLTFKHEHTIKTHITDMNMKEIARDVLTMALVPSYKPTNQGVSEEKVIMHREIKIANIKRIKMLGATYEVV